MLKSNVKKIVVCLVVMIFLVLAVNNSFASSNGDIFNKLNNLNETDSEQIQSGNRVQNNVVNEEANNTLNVTNSNTNKTNENTPKETPYTGLNDGSTIIFIAIFIGSAIYGAIKVKKYNV